MATRHISTVCSFVLAYVRCELPEDKVDVIVKVRTMLGTHTLKDRDIHILKFRPWSIKALRARLTRYVERRPTVAAAASVAPALEQAMNREK